MSQVAQLQQALQQAEADKAADDAQLTHAEQAYQQLHDSFCTLQHQHAMLEEQACALEQQHASDQERVEATQAEYAALQAEHDLLIADLDIRQDQVGY